MNRYHIDAHRSAASMFGAATALLKEHGEPVSFATFEEARAHADALNARRWPNVWYVAHRIARPAARTATPFRAAPDALAERFHDEAG